MSSVVARSSPANLPAITALTGDVLATGPGNVAAVLKSTGPGATGPTGDSTHVAVITIDAQGRVTALSSVAIAGVSPVGTALTRGSIYRGSAAGAVEALALGGISGSVLTRNATDVDWSTFGFVGTAAQTYTFPAVGGTVATLNAAQTFSQNNSFSAFAQVGRTSFLSSVVFAASGTNDKTVTSYQRVAFFGSSDATTPFGLRVGFTGAAALADRYVTLEAIEVGVAVGGSILLQPSGGRVAIGLSAPSTSTLHVASPGNTFMTFQSGAGNEAGFQFSNSTTVKWIITKFNGTDLGVSDSAMGGAVVTTWKTGGYFALGSLMTAAGVTYLRLNVNGSQLFVGASSLQEREMASFVPSYVVNTDASFTTRLTFNAHNRVSGTTYAREALRIESNGGAAMLGVLGHAAQALPAAYTLSGTAVRVMATDPSAAYTGIDNLQLGSVYAQLADLNTLRVAVSTEIGVLRQLITDLTGYGLTQ